MMIDHNRRQIVEPSIRRKACMLINSFKNGKRVTKKLDLNGYLKMDVGPFWRVLSKDGGHNWVLMNHQTYNREIRK